MGSISGISAYQQTNKTWEIKNLKPEHAGAASPGADQADPVKGNSSLKAEIKNWSPIDTGSSLIPVNTEYGSTIGNVQLSDKAKDYYSQLKSKFHNMDFIAVSKDMKSQVAQNAASYGNANKMVVLIDEEKLERMATDESFRKKYEGIIAMSQSRMAEAKNSLSSSGASVKNFGMSVDSNGKESFFATVERSQDMQKKRLEKKAAAKKADKAKERKRTERQEREERIRKLRDKKAERSGKEDRSEDNEDIERFDKAGRDGSYLQGRKETSVEDEKEYITFEADTMDELVDKVSTYTYNNASARVMTDAERMMGTQVDFKG